MSNQMYDKHSLPSGPNGYLMIQWLISVTPHGQTGAPYIDLTSISLCVQAQ